MFVRMGVGPDDSRRGAVCSDIAPADAKDVLRLNSLRVLVAHAFPSIRHGTMGAASHINEEQGVVFARTSLKEILNAQRCTAHEWFIQTAKARR